MRVCVKEEAEKLFEILSTPKPDGKLREVYRGNHTNRWFVTYGGGEFSPDAVKALVASGRLNPVYSNCPNDAYYTGRTWDHDRTMAARKAGQRKANYFIGDP